MRLRDMCQELDWDRSRTSHQVTRMDKKGLVAKVKCAGDARGVNVEITHSFSAFTEVVVAGNSFGTRMRFGVGVSYAFGGSN